MKVPADYICEHGMPQPWATCTDCMLLPHDLKPVPPRPAPEPPKPKPAPRKRASRAAGAAGKTAVPKSATPRQKAAPRPSTRLPKTVDDTFPPLVGTKDLAYEIPANTLRYHVQGPDQGWLPISSMPKDLRDRGWVYLQAEGELVAKCQVKGIGFRDKRWTHEHADTSFDSGPGPTLELEGEHWQFISIDLGPEGEAEISGYRYVITDAEGSVRVAVDPD